MDARSHLMSIIQTQGRARDLDMHGADLVGANLSSLCGDRLDLRAANLRGAKLRGVHFGRCRFEGGRFEATDWSGATLRMCALDEAHAAGACFDGARIEDSTATAIDLSRASLRGAHLTETLFVRAVLHEAVLDDAEGEGVEFRGADLSGATLTGARFDEADFRGADLQGADLTHGRFRSADFRGALLEGVRFESADFIGARFDQGVRPHPGTAPNTVDKGTESFDQAALTALRELLTELPTVLAAREGPGAELLDHLQRAGETLNAAANHRPEEWKPWIERLMKITNGEQSLDVKSFLDALCEGPTGLQSESASNRGNEAAAIFDHLRHAVETLNAASDRPPEEWKPWLEPLMKMTKGERPLDVQALLDALSVFTQRQPPNPAAPRSS